MRMIHLGGSEAHLSVGVEVRTSFEFLVSLAAFGSPDAWQTLDVGPGWFQQIDASMTPDARTLMCEQLSAVGFSEVTMLLKPVQPSNAVEAPRVVAA